MKQPIAIIILSVILFHCTSPKLLQEQAPLEFGEVYYETWTAGVKEAGRGIDLYISSMLKPKLKHNVVVDTVYFRGKSALTEIKKQGNTLVYIAKYTFENNSKPQRKEYDKDIETMLSDLNDNECIISYRVNGKLEYYKISNIKERRRIDYPVAPQNK